MELFGNSPAGATAWLKGRPRNVETGAYGNFGNHGKRFADVRLHRVAMTAMVTALLLVLMLTLIVTAVLPGSGIAARWRRAHERRRRALVEDALKCVHAAELRGVAATPELLAGHLRLRLRPILALLTDTEARGLTRTTDTGIALTSAGRETAVRVIRAHRLLERYFADELGMPLAAIHAAADRREHSVTVEDAAELAARLGYPTHDPHGDPIPEADGQLAPVEAIALSQQPIGYPAVIRHLEDEPPELFRQIVGAGLEPGMRIEVLDTSPTQVVIWNGDREHVLSPLAAGNVFVSPLPEPAVPTERLSSLEPGARGRVVALRSHGLTRRRLLDLGVTPGVIIERAFTSPLGEPVAYQVRGALIALRAEQAREIEIEPLGQKVA
jgi:DtxR family Mn-dependent transcriptional regulator